MADLPFVFPVIGFAGGQVFGDLECFYGDDFSRGSPGEISRRQGMVLVDMTGRSWTVSRVVVLGPARSIWLRMIGNRERWMDQELVELPPMSLDEVKSRVCESVQNYPDDWRDDEALAGEDGPPREEQEMLDELKDRVKAAQTMPQVINALWDQDLPG